MIIFIIRPPAELPEGRTSDVRRKYINFPDDIPDCDQHKYSFIWHTGSSNQNHRSTASIN